jgi:chromosome segregation ATPase
VSTENVGPSKPFLISLELEINKQRADACEQVDTKLMETVDRLSAVSEEMEGLKKDKVELESVLKAITTERDTIAGTAAEITRILNEKAMELENERSKRQEEVSREREAAESARRDAANVSLKIESFVEKVNSLTVDLDRERKISDSERNRAISVDKEAAEQRSACAELRKHIEMLSDEREKSASQFDVLRAEVEKWRNKSEFLAEVNAGLKMVVSERDRLVNEVGSISKLLEENDQENKKLHTDIEKLRDKYDPLVSENSKFSTSLAAIKAERDKLADKLAYLESNLEGGFNDKN